MLNNRDMRRYQRAIKTQEAEWEPIENQPEISILYKERGAFMVFEYAKRCARVYAVRPNGEVMDEFISYGVNIRTQRDKARKTLLSYLDGPQFLECMAR